MKEVINLLVLEVLGKFDLTYFKRLSQADIRPTTKKAQIDFAYNETQTGKSHPEIEYAKRMLPYLDKGSARTVFALSGSKALKIARNDKGLAQNKAETEVHLKNPNNSITTRVFDWSPDYKWVISEIVKPISREEFETLIGIPSLIYLQVFTLLWSHGSNIKTELQKWLARMREDVAEGEVVTQLNGKTVSYKSIIASIEQVMKNSKALEYLLSVVDFAKKNQLHPGEIVPSHFGRTVDGRVIIYDYGGTEEVIDAHYTRKPNPVD